MKKNTKKTVKSKVQFARRPFLILWFTFCFQALKDFCVLTYDVMQFWMAKLWNPIRMSYLMGWNYFCSRIGYFINFKRTFLQFKVVRFFYLNNLNMLLFSCSTQIWVRICPKRMAAASQKSSGSYNWKLKFNCFC